MLVVFLLAVSRMLGRSRLPEDDAASFLRYLIGWTLIVIAGLSVPDARKVRYLLPIVPAIAALAAYPLHAGIDPQRQGTRWIVFTPLQQTGAYQSTLPTTGFAVEKY